MRLTREKRFFRVSLRAMFAAIGVLCLLLALKVKQVKEQKKAIEWVRGVGGEVQYDFEIDDYSQNYPRQKRFVN